MILLWMCDTVYENVIIFFFFFFFFDIHGYDRHTTLLISFLFLFLPANNIRPTTQPTYAYARRVILFSFFFLEFSHLPLPISPFYCQPF